ncbi:hypothetical protein BGZ80_001499 [Entomortierella chlamydospora]|uniref:Swiss Army Knife RNA repair protein HAD domain-containing protein n=1 Tax=Entomortierella chlamydospora TaxID=101097 RepID=A0A9P6MRJ1_9FUNG|nr:hypothetical protein BGZ80_001499 [Entomortierella chlamydospora]
MQDDQEQPPYSLMTHAAVVYSSDRLSNTAYTFRLHTVNVFDFDQTLFQSPLPNPSLWDRSFLGVLTSWNYCGTGWWQNPSTLELGPEVEANCWEGWWNEEVVRKVKESSEDPGCMTLLLTGRYGPTFSQKVIEMVQRKGLDFDIIATKPTTVAQIENDSSNNNHQAPTTELYLKVDTFNTKHDLLYNLLFEYPNIRNMHLWDDRPCQIAKFREVGQKWLDKNMLDHFDVTTIQEPLLYMNPQREIDTVLAMVESNNQQADVEANGGPFLVPGVGPLPRIRPELRDLNMWEPYETYTPKPRNKIEVTKVARYTGVMFSDAVQRVLRGKFGAGNGFKGRNDDVSEEHWIRGPQNLEGMNLGKWVVPDDIHVTLCLGAAQPDFIKTIGGLGATVLVEVEAVGEHEKRIWALRVKEFDVNSCNDSTELHIVAPDGNVYTSLGALRSAYASREPQQENDFPQEESSVREVGAYMAKRLCGSSLEGPYSNVDLDHLGHIVLNRDIVPHITMAYDRLNGTRPVDSGLIQNWESLTTPNGEPFQPRLVFVGTISEKYLLGMKSLKTKHSSSSSCRDVVNLAAVVKTTRSKKNIPRAELGRLIEAIKEEMEMLSVENKTSNLERIEIIAQEVWERAETMKATKLLPQ